MIFETNLEAHSIAALCNLSKANDYRGSFQTLGILSKFLNWKHIDAINFVLWEIKQRCKMSWKRRQNSWKNWELWKHQLHM